MMLRWQSLLPSQGCPAKQLQAFCLHSACPTPHTVQVFIAPGMLYDLCIGQASLDSLALRDLLAEATVLGYDAVAVDRRTSKTSQLK